MVGELHDYAMMTNIPLHHLSARMPMKVIRAVEKLQRNFWGGVILEMGRLLAGYTFDVQTVVEILRTMPFV